MDTIAIGVGLIVMGIAVAIGGLILEAVLLLIRRSLSTAAATDAAYDSDAALHSGQFDESTSNVHWAKSAPA